MFLVIIILSIVCLGGGIALFFLKPFKVPMKFGQNDATSWTVFSKNNAEGIPEYYLNRYIFIVLGIFLVLTGLVFIYYTYILVSAKAFY